MEKTIEIPEGYEARIESNKVILKRKESEDERIRKELVFYLGDMPEDTELRNGVTNRDVLSYLERQKEQPEVDLITEYDEQFDSHPVYGRLANRNTGIVIARHFYELGLNARKEE